MEVESPAHPLLGELPALVGAIRNLDVLAGPQAADEGGIGAEDLPLPHFISACEGIKRLARLHGVDIILRAVDINDRRGAPIGPGREGAKAPDEQQGRREESFHRHLVFSRIRISVMTFLV